MNNKCVFHDLALRETNEAFALKSAGRYAEAKEKFLNASEFEARSARFIENSPGNEPSRSMLFLKAASLAWHGEDFELAQRLIGEGIGGYPPDDVKNELFKLFDEVNLSIIEQKGEGMSDGRKDDQGKDRYDLVPPIAYRAIASVMTHGAETYGENNWQGVAISRYYAALMRHLMAWREGEALDKSGMPHLWHVLTNAAFMVYLDKDNQ